MKTATQAIIDSHMHLWDLSLKKHSWLLEPSADFFLGDYSALKKNYLLADYRQDSQNFNVEKTVYVQAGWDRNDLLGEAKWINQINDGLIGAIVTYADLSQPNIEEQLEQLSQIPLVRGIRQIAAWHQDPIYCSCEKNFVIDPTWQKNLSTLKNYDLVFDLQIFPEQTDAAYELIKNNEHITFVIEHVLQPIQHDQNALQAWQIAVNKLAKLPNTFMKLSGIFLFTHQVEIANIHFLIENCIDAFSPERCLFGSNFPVEKLFISFDQLYKLFFSVGKQYSGAEQAALFYNTAKKIYRL